MKIIKLKGNFLWAGRRPTRRMCALILNAIWPLTNNAVKGGGKRADVLQQQVTCVLTQRIILRIRRLGFGFLFWGFDYSFCSRFVGAVTYVHVLGKPLAECLIYDFVN